MSPGGTCPRTLNDFLGVFSIDNVGSKSSTDRAFILLIIMRNAFQSKTFITRNQIEHLHGTTELDYQVYIHSITCSCYI